MKKLLREASLAVGVLTLLAGVVNADPRTRPGQKKADDSQKTVILQLDASKLSPELLAKLIEAAGQSGVKNSGSPNGGTKSQPDQLEPRKKPAADTGKTLNLTQAIAYAEKYTQGTAYKAEYEDGGFVVAVKTEKGSMKVKMDAYGNIDGDKADNSRGKKKPGSKKK